MREALIFVLLVVAQAGCSGDAATRDRASDAAGIHVLDDTGHPVVLRAPARRVVSLVPAVTEIIFALDRGDRLVGRTRYGTHPPSALAVPSVGDGIRPDPERILARRPDLVILFAGPDNESSLARLRELALTVLAVEHSDLADLHRNIRRLGLLLGAVPTADSLWSAIEDRLDEVGREARGGGPPVPVYYDLGGEPPYTIGGGSYIDSLLTLAGGRNVFGDVAAPSPLVNLESIVARHPACIIVGTRADPSSAAAVLRDRPGWSAVPAVSAGRVFGVDAELIDRLGPRLGAAAAALRDAVDRCRSVEGGRR